METWQATIKEVGNDFTLKPTWTGSMYEDVVDEAIHDALICQYLRNFWGLNRPDVEWYTLKKIEPAGLGVTQDHVDRLRQHMREVREMLTENLVLTDDIITAIGKAYSEYFERGITMDEISPTDYVRAYLKKFLATKETLT